MYTQELNVQAHITVASIFRDGDGYGNNDEDIWTLRVKVSGWPDTTEFIARYEQELQIGTQYNVRGFFYIDHGKEWTCTYLRIHTVQQSDNPENDPPTFDIRAVVARVTQTHIVLVWQVWEEYEAALYQQSAKFQLENPLPQEQENLVQSVRRVSGVMKGVQQEHWICKQITL